MELNRISGCTYPVRNEPLEYTFGLFAGAGYRKIDLWGGPPNYSNDPEECDILGLKGAAAGFGLSIANLGTYPGRKLLDVGYEAELREMHRAIDNAVLLGSRSIRVSPGYGEDASIIPYLIGYFEESAAYAAEGDIFLGMENHQGSIAADPDNIMRLVDAVGSSHFGILYEPANLMACRVDYKSAYEKFAGHVTHVHVKDSRWDGDRYERTMLGEGEVDLEWLVRTLEADGYEGDYALEFEIEERVPVEQGLPAWLSYFCGIGPV